MSSDWLDNSLSVRSLSAQVACPVARCSLLTSAHGVPFTSSSLTIEDAAYIWSFASFR